MWFQARWLPPGTAWQGASLSRFHVATLGPTLLPSPYSSWLLTALPLPLPLPAHRLPAPPLPSPPFQAFIYLASIQLLFSSPPTSVLAGGCGLLAGLLYRINFLGMQRLRLPAAIVDLFSTTVGRVLTGPGQPQQVFVTPTAAQLMAQQQQAAAAVGMGGGGGGMYPPGAYGGRQQAGAQMTQRGGGGGGGAAAAAAAAAAVEASPEAVQQLVAMGFDEAQASAALRQTGNNVEAALQYLL